MLKKFRIVNIEAKRYNITVDVMNIETLATESIEISNVNFYPDEIEDIKGKLVDNIPNDLIFECDSKKELKVKVCDLIRNYIYFWL